MEIEKINVELLSKTKLRKILLATYPWDNGIRNHYSFEGLKSLFNSGLKGVHQNQFRENLKNLAL